MEVVRLTLLSAIVCVSVAGDWEITVSMSRIQSSTICTNLSVTFYEREDDGSSSPAPNVTMEISMPSVSYVNIPDIKRPMKIDVWNDGNIHAANYRFEQLTMRKSSFHLTFECNCYLGADGSKQTLYPNEDRWEIIVSSSGFSFLPYFYNFDILVHDISGVGQIVSSTSISGTYTINVVLHVDRPVYYTTLYLSRSMNSCIQMTFKHTSTCRSFSFECWNLGTLNIDIGKRSTGIISNCFPTTTTTAIIPPICINTTTSVPTTTPTMTSIHTTTTSVTTATPRETSIHTTTTSVTTATPRETSIHTTTNEEFRTTASTTTTAASTSTTTTISAATTTTTMTPSGSQITATETTTTFLETDTSATASPPAQMPDSTTDPESGEITESHSASVATSTTQIWTTENSIALSNLSCCPCGPRKPITNVTSSQLQEIVMELRSHLSVNKSALSAIIRKKTCATDIRPSSKAIGMTGAVLLAIPFILLISFDLSRLFSNPAVKTV